MFILLIAVGLFCSAYSQCNPDLWEHIYHPKRLVVKEACKTVKGIVYHRKKEADGDWHIRLRLAKEDMHLLNQRNYENQDTCLVIEIICCNKVTQADAIASCQGCDSVRVPKKGDYVEVTGAYVWDNENATHGWMETPCFKHKDP